MIERCRLDFKVSTAQITVLNSQVIIGDRLLHYGGSKKNSTCGSPLGPVEVDTF